MNLSRVSASSGLYVPNMSSYSATHRARFCGLFLCFISIMYLYTVSAILKPNSSSSIRAPIRSPAPILLNFFVNPSSVIFPDVIGCIPLTSYAIENIAALSFSSRSSKLIPLLCKTFKAGYKYTSPTYMSERVSNILSLFSSSLFPIYSHLLTQSLNLSSKLLLSSTALVELSVAYSSNNSIGHTL